jgi:hypothetical protein
MDDVALPYVDVRRRLLFLAQAESRGRGPVTAMKAEEMRPGLYPSTKGVTLVNDGVAYGERVQETFYVLVSAGADENLDERSVTSVRTRTGQAPLPKDEEKP